jgi:hypothetical protein
MSEQSEPIRSVANFLYDQNKKPSTSDKKAWGMLINGAFLRHEFPPIIHQPELVWECTPLGVYDHCHAFWIPESKMLRCRPQCIVSNCGCTPSIKEYRRLLVHGVHFRTWVYYVAYTCSSKDKANKNLTADQREARSFCTTSPKWLAMVDEHQFDVSAHLFFTPRVKIGVTKLLDQFIHDAITSPYGLNSQINVLEANVSSRFAMLRTLSLSKMDEKRKKNPECILPKDKDEKGMYICMCMCLCICMCVRICMCVCMYMCMGMGMFTCMGICMCIFKRMCMCPCRCY